MLPWNFEAFRRFLAFDIMQQASAALLVYEGQPIFSDSSLMKDFTERLNKRTGLEWAPARQVSEGVKFDIEGSVFRNKARVFTSFYIIDPSCLEEKQNLRITEFGKALGLGFIIEPHFYEEIIKRFEYPHPAYQDNWESWKLTKQTLKPLLYILDLLVKIHDLDDEGHISAEEIATFAHEGASHKLTKKIAKTILESRSTSKKTKRERTDQVDRKINDMLGFLCISGFTFYEGNRVKLNLLDNHLEEKSYFWGKRNGQDRKQYLEKLIRENIEV